MAVELVERRRAAERVVGLGLLAHLADADDLAAEPPEPARDHVADRAARGRRCGPRRARRRPRSRRPPRGARPSPAACAWISRHARSTALPMQHRRAAGRRLLVVRHDRGVAHHDRDPVERRAELVGGDLGEDRPRALAHVGRAGVDDDAAVGQQADRRVGEAGRRARLQADRDAATATGAARASPSRSSRRLGATVSAQSPSAGVSPGMNASPGAARFSQAQLERVDAERRAPPRPCSIRPPRSAAGLPKPRNAVDGTVCESTLRATIRTAGHAVRPVGRVAALGDGPVGDVGVRADQVVRPRCRGRRACRRAGSRSGRGPRTLPGEPPGTSPRASARGAPAGPARSAMNASSGSYLACCLPPNAPPGSGAKTRTLESGRPQELGDDPLEPVRVLDRAPDRDPVAVGRGHERVRLDRELGDHREARTCPRRRRRPAVGRASTSPQP